eukprot:9912544-Ditylum_brightwellii.AAC.1
MNYQQLIKDPATAAIWSKGMCRKLGRLAQGWKNEEKGTDTTAFLNKQEIKHIPDDRTVTYARIIVDYHPQKKGPNQVRITVDGNLINYPGDVATNTADLITTKILWNSILSTPGAKYVCIDIKNFYLETPM